MREALIVPQTPRHVALHADVLFAVRATRTESVRLEDAHLHWLLDGGGATMKSIRWDRAVINGRFSYPPALEVEIEREPAAEVTLTFTDGLIQHADGRPPKQSKLVLELLLEGGKRLRYDLWRVRMEDWQQPRADLEWLR